MLSNPQVIGRVRIESPISDYVRIYKVKQSVMDRPTTYGVQEIGYITTEPGLMPDLLIPWEKSDIIRVGHDATSLWREKKWQIKMI